VLDLDIRRAVLELRDRGQGVRAIARALKVSRNSVRRVLASGKAEVPAIERVESLGEHRDRIKALYADCQGNRVRVIEELASDGVEISYSTLTAFCRRHGIGVKEKRPAGRYDFAPGQEMQHDTSPHDVRIGDKVRRVQCASLVLCFSRIIYAQVYPQWNRFGAKVFLTEALQVIGGAATRCMLDNSSVVIARGTGKNAVPAPEMAAFADRFGFEFAAHELGDANRSARVERPFHYIENNFYPGRSFADLADLNTQLAAWCQRANTSFKKHLMTRPIDLFATERPSLKALPIYIPEVYDLACRMVDVEGFVCLHNNRYQVPDSMIGRKVEVRESKDRVRIFDGSKELAVYPRVERGLQKRSMLAEPSPGRSRRTSHAAPLRQEQELIGVGPEIADLTRRLRAHHGGRAVREIRALHRLYLDYPTDALRRAAARALQYGLLDLVRIEKMLLAEIAGNYFRLGMNDDDQDKGDE